MRRCMLRLEVSIVCLDLPDNCKSEEDVRLSPKPNTGAESGSGAHQDGATS
jgi:hypothetical protein